jgi:hypothetical protein
MKRHATGLAHELLNLLRRGVDALEALAGAVDE